MLILTKLTTLLYKWSKQIELFQAKWFIKKAISKLEKSTNFKFIYQIKGIQKDNFEIKPLVDNFVITEFLEKQEDDVYYWLLEMFVKHHISYNFFIRFTH